MTEMTETTVELDLSDVDHRVSKPVGGGQLWEPCAASDIRRGVMAMDKPAAPSHRTAQERDPHH